MEKYAFQDKLRKEIETQGVDFIHFVDISQLCEQQNKGYPGAILIGKALTKDYLRTVSGVPNYVEQMIQNNQVKNDEFHLTEIETDRIADRIANFLSDNGFDAYSQSEDNLDKTGNYDKKHNTTPLPHKTIAGLCGFGWIGKHNLLITPNYGSAISMCTVLTDAPLVTKLHKSIDSSCGDCNICVDICSVNAIKGKSWNAGISRDEIVNVFLCNTCFKCVVHCPWTKKYMKRSK